MFVHVAPGVLVLALDVPLELAAFHPPLTPAADPDRRQVASPDQRVRLVYRDVEDLCDVGDAEESR
jgi:hypothetical protein